MTFWQHLISSLEILPALVKVADYCQKIRILEYPVWPLERVSMPSILAKMFDTLLFFHKNRNPIYSPLWTMLRVRCQ